MNVRCSGSVCLCVWSGLLIIKQIGIVYIGIYSRVVKFTFFLRKDKRGSSNVFEQKEVPHKVINRLV